MLVESGLLEPVLEVVVWGVLEVASPLPFVSGSLWESLAVSLSSLQPCCPVRGSGGRDLVGLERGVLVMSENTLLSASSVSGLVLGPESWEECGSVSGHDGGRGGVWMSNKAASMESNSSAVLLLPSSQPRAPPPSSSSLLCCLPSHPFLHQRISIQWWNQLGRLAPWTTAWKWGNCLQTDHQRASQFLPTYFPLGRTHCGLYMESYWFLVQ